MPWQRLAPSTSGSDERTGRPRGEDRGLSTSAAQREACRAAQELETFGYEADAVWRDPAVMAYCDLFGVERELSRMIDTSTGS